MNVTHNSVKPVVKVYTPRGWDLPEPPLLRNNRNHLSDPATIMTPPAIPRDFQLVFKSIQESAQE